MQATKTKATNSKSLSSLPAKLDTNARDRSTSTNGHTPQSSQPTHEEIARLARELFIQSGRQEGQDAENWFKAERTLRQSNPGKATSGRQHQERSSSPGAERLSQR
jgi:hypothetical protein